MDERISAILEEKVHLLLSDRPYGVQKDPLTKKVREVDRMNPSEVQRLVDCESPVLSDRGHALSRIAFHSFNTWITAYTKSNLHARSLPNIMIRSKKDVRNVRHFAWDMERKNYAVYAHAVQSSRQLVVAKPENWFNDEEGGMPPALGHTGSRTLPRKWYIKDPSTGQPYRFEVHLCVLLFSLARVTHPLLAVQSHRVHALHLHVHETR